MEPAPLAPPGFTVAFFPVWTLAADVTAPGVGPVLTLFTDDDLARRFAEDIRLGGVAPLPIPDRAALIEHVERAMSRGVGHVAVDVSFHPPSGQLHPAAAFLADIRNSPAPHGRSATTTAPIEGMNAPRSTG
jgi:hypothetical protein